ncbi:hypothetical protein MMC24_000148 [Lignoscripta atroalba]|nr:hypothetical protein [Lignoscripta atroalba]
MAFWPFGRKSRKTNLSHEKSMRVSKGKGSETARQDPGHTSPEVNASNVGRRPSRRESQRRKRTSSGKLTKVQKSRTRDSEKTEPLLPTAAPPLSVPQTRNYIDEKASAADDEQPDHPLISLPTDREDTPSSYFQNALSQTSLRPEKFSVNRHPPTLSAKRNATDTSLSRQKSSKRKADDFAREQEIKAMSSTTPAPKRPVSHGSGVLARDTKRIPGGLNRNFGRPTSEISLPLPDSMHSSMSGASDMHGFKVSALDALSPRPTIRYSENPRYAAGSSLGASRTSARLMKRPLIAEEAFQPKDRIDDIADDLDAGGLRELMDRDKRRRDKKRKSDQEKLQRRLQRRAEKQKAEGRSAEDNTGKESERDTALGFGHVGLGIDEPAAERSSVGQSKEVTRSPETWLKDPSRERSPPEDPFMDPGTDHEMSRLEEPTPADDREEPIVETATAVRLSQANISPPSSPTQHARLPSRLSTRSDVASRSTPDIPERMELETPRRDSDTSARLGSTWTSFFRRGGNRGKRGSADRGRTTPSEFSNTSRESFARQPPLAFTRNIRARSGTPVRTQSKFREDLPEMPMSPPDSRMQSPEVAVRHARGSYMSGTAGGASASDQPLSDIHPAFREEVALSRQQSLHAPSPDGPSTALLSQSLASVDSEASWISGRPPKRSSQTQISPLRGSAGSLQQRLQELSGSEEDLGAANDGYLRNLTTGGEGGFAPREPSSTQRRASSGAIAIDSDDESVLQPPPNSRVGDQATLHGAVARRPTIIKTGPRAKSREGLLNEFIAGDESPGSSPSADSPAAESSEFQIISPENPSVHRATSVDYGKRHARHISAGSARLLNLPARNSVEQRRLSSASGEKSPLGMPDQGREPSAEI